MDILAENGTYFLLLAGFFGLCMTWGIGANDVANAMGTSVGSGAISLRRAIVLAAIFEFGGAFLAGERVTETIRDGIINPESLADQPEVLIWGMLSALIAGAVWLLFASSKGWPVSATHTIVGGIVGFGLVGPGTSAIEWARLVQILASWLLAPLLGGVIAYFLMWSIRQFILNTERPLDNARRYGPVYLFLAGFVISEFTLFKGLGHLDLALSAGQSITIALVFALGVACIGSALIARIRIAPDATREFLFASVERVFAPMLLFTACAMAFAHGSNDVANGIGPLAAVVSIVRTGGVAGMETDTSNWILALGGFGMVLGIASMGYRVMVTVGSRITALTPTRGFCASLAAGATVMLASRTGLPVSTTHVVVGAVIGVGIARGVGAMDLRVLGGILLAWIVTLPVAGALAALLFLALWGIFG